ncbi:MAG: HD domain-containing protein [Clostridia bacterium]|nr:HD domain-containing protein [Clostridia bacterium]
MPEPNAVLVLKHENNADILTIEYISNNSIPETLNGESGFHVYHVRMLTELILKKYSALYPESGLTEKNISDISVASSLHDIGKMKIPQSILDYPGKLSPLEYDIVKKHSVFGEEIIANTNSFADSEIIRHAKEIARYHHERYDATGYPDGLRGDNIPLSAQVVSLADSFDALTSARSYKKAFSQDVAIEMIANGMCGVFKPELIECLLSVVNNKVLTDIRNRLEEKRSVVLGKNIFEPKNVLFLGNTGYITEEFIDETFPGVHITVVGDSNLKNTHLIKAYTLKKPSMKRIFETYDFDLVIYLAKELSYNSTGKSDAEDLREILASMKSTQKDSRFMYISSLDAAFSESTDRALLSRAKENLCEHYADKFDMNIKIVRIPYLYLSTYKKDYLYSLFDHMESEKSVKMEEFPASKCHFISSFDLSELIVRLTDNWKPGPGILNINDEFSVTFSDLTEKLSLLKPGVSFEYLGEKESADLNSINKAVRNEYGWFEKISIIDDINEQYEKFNKQKNHIVTSFFDKAKEWIKNHTLIAKLAELFGLFIITEILVYATNSAVLFSIVDFRMAYIVIIAVTHGLSYGIGAAGLSSLSWLIAKISTGTKWITIFYEPTNWLAFVYYFLIGSVCGYVKLKSTDKISSLNEQNTLLEEKLIFTRELYTDNFNEKRELKKQIIGSKDSFGKIFDITKQLDTAEPTKLYLKIMDTFESVLENKTISVYSINDNSAFGRLEVASKEIVHDAARSISLDSYSELIETVSKKEIWKNTSFKPGLPMYASGVMRDSKLELLIFIWHSSSDQQSLYYVNLFKILCDLVQMSLLRARDYTAAIYEKQYIANTRIYNSEAFSKIYDNFRQMSDRKVFSFIRLEFDCDSLSHAQANKILSGKIRANDILGVGENGKLNLLLSQATTKDLGFILPRFENTGIKVTVLDN